jgi:hypothetical protein
MKKINRKLNLHRETLRNLDPRDIAKLNGGVVWTGCLSDCTECGGGTFPKQYTVVEPSLISQ